MGTLIQKRTRPRLIPVPSCIRFCSVYSSSADSSVATAEMAGSLTDDQADTVVGSPPLATEEWGSPHARPLPLQGALLGSAVCVGDTLRHILTSPTFFLCFRFIF